MLQYVVLGTKTHFLYYLDCSRMLFLGVLISGTVFWACYQASLTSVLAVVMSRVPIGSLVTKAC